MRFEYDRKNGRMVGCKTQYLSRREIERLGGIVPDNRHVNPGTAYVPDSDIVRVKMLAHRYDVEVTRLAGYDREIGGSLYRFERTIAIG